MLTMNLAPSYSSGPVVQNLPEQKLPFSVAPCKAVFSGVVWLEQLLHVGPLLPLSHVQQ